MAHQLQLEKNKYRQWVKTGLGLLYLKEGLESFCQDIAEQQHKAIVDNIKQTKSLPTVTCGQCTLRTLKPDHVKTGNKQCPLGQVNCNCCFTNGKIACPNNVCGAIYDEIVSSHGSRPPAPYWKNTDTTQWTTDPWSIAKCFINAPGYEQKSSAADTDCTGLLHVIINNKYFHNHIGCKITGADVFSKVRQYRNKIFHSSTMELKEAVANTYIDDMIAVLQDGKELINRKDAQDAVKKLEELKNEDFIMTTENMEKVLGDIREELGNLRKSTEGLATKDDCEDLKRKFSALESLMSEQTEEIKRLKTDNTAQQEQSDYEKSKLELQTRLIELYREEQLHMSAIPLQQEGNLSDFKDVYVRPRMTIESKDKKDKKDDKKEVDVVSMSDIFTNNDKPIKSIYVLGEAGSGKSSFCKSLVNYWCLAHSGGQSIKYDFSGVKEMKKFEFLFLLPLRHFTDKIKIKEMLEEKYEHPALKKLLESESRTCLVVLDGLDEWDPPTSKSQIKSPPKRDSLKDYTVITTSRPWKIGTLGITDNEIRQKIILKGFDELSVKNMIKNAVTILNAEFKEDKDPSDCGMALENKSVKSLKQTAITLQQLICLWFDNKLHGTSKCALYTGMLDMFFDWNEKKYPDDPRFAEMRRKSEDLKNVELPQYLIDTEVCKWYSYIIHGVSQLAYETLFNNTKETSLSFDSSTFERLKISNEVKACCLQLGILSEDKCSSLFASRSRRSAIAFVHKSFQEYLAAVYITISFKVYIAPLADSGTADLPDKCAEFFQTNFSTCATLDEIFEQINVFTMLGGLEPRLATSISKYIYDIFTRDKRVLEYRRTIDQKHKYLILDIQQCILNCIEEVQSSQTDIQSSFHLGDIVLQSKSDFENFCTTIDQQYISPDSVMSFRIGTFEAKEYVKRVLKYLQKCRRLEAIRIDRCFITFINYYEEINYKTDDEVIKPLCDTFEGNISTLQALYVNCDLYEKFKPIYKTIVRSLPDMSHLVALKIESLIMTHADFTSLCTFLSGTSQLEQISIYHIYCECRNQHEVDLSKQEQLQYLRYSKHVCVTRVNTSNLQIYKCVSLISTHCVKVLDSLSTANKLTYLVLEYGTYYDLTPRGSSDKTPSYHTVTDKLITLIPLLHQLRELELLRFTFTDNIIKCPSEMKSIKRISLYSVRMSVTTWCKFVDSVSVMPLPVQVGASQMCITPDGEEYKPYIVKNWKRGGERAAAWQSVREQKALFKVEHDIDWKIKKIRAVGQETAAWQCVREQEELFNMENDIDWGIEKIRTGGQEAAARQYVREQKALFNVELESDDLILFSTKK